MHVYQENGVLKAEIDELLEKVENGVEKLRNAVILQCSMICPSVTWWRYMVCREPRS